MSVRLSNHEWEQLSAYVDGQLALDEKTRLEERLKSESELQTLLLSLRKTKSLLRNLPVIPIPRSFTLTPEMAGLKPKRPFFLVPVFSAMSVLSLILLALTILFRTSVAVPQSAEKVTTAAMEAFQAPLLEETTIQPTPMIIYWSPPYVGGRGGGDTLMTQKSQTTQDEIAPLLPEALPAPEIMATPVTVAQAPLVGNGPILGIRSTEKEAQAMPPAPSIPTQEIPLERSQPPQETSTAPPLASQASGHLAVQISLAAAAVLSGLAALFLWRRFKT